MSSLVPDPATLYRVRDGIYAADLLITAVTDLDFFTWLNARGPLRASELADELQLAQRPADVLLTYCAALGPALAAAVEDLPIGALLDIGGSSGSYANAIIQGRPEARAAVFERPPVDQAARTLLRERGAGDRISVITGDMFTDPLPHGYDVHLYSQVLHDWDAQRVEHLLAASFAALPPGGWLLDHDTHINADKQGPLPTAEYSVLLMHSTPGKCWSTAELADIAQRIGYVDVTHRHTVCDRSVLLARKPGRRRSTPP